MVKRGTRLTEAYVAIAEISKLSTPSPTVSNKDAADLGQKIRYLIDQTEAILVQTDLKLSQFRDALRGAGNKDLTTLEADLENLNNKIPSDPAREGGNLAAIAGRFNVNLDTRASESTLSTLNDKIRSPVDDVFSKDVSVGSTTAVQIDTDTQVRDAITILADSANTDDILIGNNTSQTFPLSPGSSLTLRKCSLSKIYAIAASGTQTLHVITGGI